MATSGQNTYSTTTQKIVKKAFVEATIYRQNASIKTEDYNLGVELLNDLSRGWQATGFRLWNDERATLFLQKGIAKYELSSTGTNATESFVSTTLGADVLSGASTVDVASITGISDGDYIGILKDDGTLFWTTVNGDPAVLTVTITDAIDDDATSGATVFAYTTKITKPMEVTQVMYQQNSTNEVILSRLERQNYFELSNKAATGNPNQYYFDRKRTQGDLYLWSTPSDETTYVNFTYQPYLEDFVSQGDEPDYPIEWERALTSNLALELCNSYGIGAETYSKVTAKAEMWLKRANSSNNENGSLTFDMDYIWQ